MDPVSPALSDLHAVVEALAEASTALTEMPMGRRAFPSRTALAALVEELRALLFPGYFGTSELKVETLRYHLGARLDRVLHDLADQVQRGLMASDPTCGDCGERALGLARSFAHGGRCIHPNGTYFGVFRLVSACKWLKARGVG